MFVICIFYYGICHLVCALNNYCIAGNYCRANFDEIFHQIDFRCSVKAKIDIIQNFMRQKYIG